MSLMGNNRIILASQSKARAQILDQTGLTYDQISSHLDEDHIKKEFEHLSVEDLTKKLAFEKANCIAKDHKDIYIIASDQILSFENKRFDKAESLEQAREQLKTFRGKEHFLVNGVSIFYNGKEVFSYGEKARLVMRDFSDEFIDEYIDSLQSEILRSVGCYQIEGLGIHLFEEIDGNIFSIMGLPILPILSFLREKNVIKR